MEDNQETSDTIWLVFRQWLGKVVEGMQGSSLSVKAQRILKDMQIQDEMSKNIGFQK